MATWQERRAKYEFDKGVKKYAIEKAGYRCQRCGCKPTKENRLEVHHALPIVAVIKEFPFIAPEIVKHISNAEVLCRDCHINEVHGDMNENDWQFLAHALIDRYTQWVRGLIGEEVMIFSGDD